jgi:hypothetical protein
VGVDHGRLHTPVSEQLLHRPNVVPVHQQVGRKGVSQGMEDLLSKDLAQEPALLPVERSSRPCPKIWTRCQIF